MLAREYKGKEYNLIIIIPLPIFQIGKLKDISVSFPLLCRILSINITPNHYTSIQQNYLAKFFAKILTVDIHNHSRFPGHGQARLG